MNAARLPRYSALGTAVLLYALAFVFIGLRLTSPSDGARLWLNTQNPVSGAVAVTPLVLRPGGLQMNDPVIAVGRKPLTEWASAVLDTTATSPQWIFNQVVSYTVMRGTQTLDVPVKLGVYPLGIILRENALVVVFLVTLQAGAAWLFYHRPDEHTTQTLFLAACALVTFSVCWFFGMDIAALVNFKGLWLYFRATTFVMIMLMCAALLHFALLLPRMRTPYRIDRWLIALIYIAPYPIFALFLALTYEPNRLEWLRHWESGVLLLVFVYFGAVLVAIVTGYSRLHDPLERKRVEAVALAFILAAFLAITLGWIPLWVTGQPSLGWATLPLFSLPIILGIGFAIMSYRLFDLRIVIQRTLIWSALTSMVIVVYILVVGVLGMVFQAQSSPVFSLIGTGLAAVLFHPVRHWLQKGVSALMFGDRDMPYEVVARLTARLEAALAPQAALDTIVQTIGEALKLSYVAIELCQDSAYVVVAEYGARDSVPTADWVEFPLNYSAENVGRLLAAPRAPGDFLTGGDRRLITGLVHHAEITIQTARLTADLQRSREKIVLAREEERRRLRRELHDGLGPTLASLTLEIDAARNFLNRDTARADTLLVDLKTQVQTAVADIRRMVYELRPPALDELGLVAALQEKARQIGQTSDMDIIVDALLLPPLPAAIENAAYRIVLEAVTNAARHAQASRCCICLTVNGCLRIEVSDNGRGLPSNHQRGVGINSMLERAAELGGTCVVENAPDGGARVVALLPIISSLLHEPEEEKTP